MTIDESRAAGKNDVRNKFWRLVTKAMGDERTTEADLRVMFFVVQWYGYKGRTYTFTTNERLADATSMDARSVKRSIHHLVQLGYLAVKRRGRWGRASEYVPGFLLFEVERDSSVTTEMSPMSPAR